MFRKLIFSLVLCLVFLFIVSSFVMASEPNRPAYQMGMGTPTPVPQALSTPLPELLLSGSAAQTGACPMMGDSGMTGTGVSGMPMGGMSGMNMMGGMGMSGTSGMPMGSMTGMSGVPYPWYSNPWWLLGWVLLGLLIVAILAGAVFGVFQLTRRSKPIQPIESS